MSKQEEQEDLEMAQEEITILLNQLLRANDITVSQLARRVQLPQSRMSQVVNGKRRITPETAEGLALAFGVHPTTWMFMQSRADSDYYFLKCERERIKQYDAQQGLELNEDWQIQRKLMMDALLATEN